MDIASERHITHAVAFALIDFGANLLRLLTVLWTDLATSLISTTGAFAFPGLIAAAVAIRIPGLIAVAGFISGLIALFRIAASGALIARLFVCSAVFRFRGFGSGFIGPGFLLAVLSVFALILGFVSRVFAILPLGILSTLARLFAFSRGGPGA